MSATASATFRRWGHGDRRRLPDRHRFLANLTVAWWGPGWSIVNAFILIGFDLASRDRLHDRWQHNRIVPKMGALIAAGGLISWALNSGAGQIALASTVAFVLAALADTVTYVALGKRARLVRMNGSNVVGAGVDSLVFPTLAFGGLMWWVTLGQFAAKTVGGFIWSLILTRGRK